MSVRAPPRLICAWARISELATAFAPLRRLPRGVDAAFPGAVKAGRVRLRVGRIGSSLEEQAWKSGKGPSRA
jgi:hypothetical protein